MENCYVSVPFLFNINNGSFHAHKKYPYMFEEQKGTQKIMCKSKENRRKILEHFHRLPMANSQFTFTVSVHEEVKQ